MYSLLFYFTIIPFVYLYTKKDVLLHVGLECQKSQAGWPYMFLKVVINVTENFMHFQYDKQCISTFSP